MSTPADRKDLIDLLIERFRGRPDRYLLETPWNRRAIWKKEPLTPAVLQRHLLGEGRIGVGVADDGTTSYLMFDLDGKNKDGTASPEGRRRALASAQRILQVMDADLGWRPLLEVSRSGAGFHVWIFFATTTPPSLQAARTLGQLILRAAGLPDDGDETKGHPGIFPHPPGALATGRAGFLPWAGLLNGAGSGKFVTPTEEPLEDQAAALRDATLLTRDTANAAHELLRTGLEEIGKSPAETRKAQEPETPRSSAALPLDPVPGVPRHRVLRDGVMRLRNFLPQEEVRIIAFAFAHRWGMLPGRESEVEALVTGAYTKPALSEQSRPILGPATFEGITESKAGAVPWLVENLLPKGELCLLAANWKVGKSLFAYSLVLSVLEGELVFGRFRVERPLRVAVFQFELPHREDLRRFRKLALGMGVDPAEIITFARDGALAFFPRPPLDLSKREHVEVFHECVRQNRADLVLVDSALAAFAGRDLNDNSEVRWLLTSAFQSLTSEGRTILLLHHYRKPQGPTVEQGKAAVLGAGQFGAAAGAIYGLERVRRDSGEGKGSGFKIKLSAIGSWSPDDLEDITLAIEDTLDDTATTVRVVEDKSQLQPTEGALPKVQQAALNIKNRVARFGRIARKAALIGVRGDLGFGERVVIDGLEYARLQGWVQNIPSQNAMHGELDLIPGSPDPGQVAE